MAKIPRFHAVATAEPACRLVPACAATQRWARAGARSADECVKRWDGRACRARTSQGGGWEAAGCQVGQDANGGAEHEGRDEDQDCPLW